MAWRGSFSRSLMFSARTSAFRSSPPLSIPRRIRPPSLSSTPPQPRRFSFSYSRTLGELGCAQSLMPMVVGSQLASHLTVNVRAFCELSHGT